MSEKMVIQVSRIAVVVFLSIACLFGVSAVALASGADILPIAVDATKAVGGMDKNQIMAAITLASLAALVLTVYFFVKFITVFFKQIVVGLCDIKAALGVVNKDQK